VIFCLSEAGNKPLEGMGLGCPSTALALILSFAETMLQSVLKLTPPLALDAL